MLEPIGELLKISPKTGNSFLIRHPVQIVEGANGAESAKQAVVLKEGMHAFGVSSFSKRAKLRRRGRSACDKFAKATVWPTMVQST